MTPFIIVPCMLSSVAMSEQPNIVWISCEDISPHLGCYGDPHAITPNLDKLAQEGTRYTNAFTTAGVCAPCRSAIITGMYQNSIGTHHMRCNATLPTWLKPFPVYLREAGYYCTNNSKTDYQFSKPAKKEIWDICGAKGHWKNRPQKSQPFFAVFNFTGCHESGIASESKYKSVTEDLLPSQRQNPKELTTLPPYYPDTTITREDWKRNYELITAMDAWAGDLIQQLKDAGEYDNTIIIYWSDHGVGLPRAKRWLYDSGTHIPLIIRVPAKFQKSLDISSLATDNQLISAVDFAPTVLNIAGIDPPSYLQGRAFLGLHLSPPRKFVYGARDRMDERYDIIRTVRGPQYRYIRNFEPLKPYYQYMNTPEKGATMQEIRKKEASGQLDPVMALFSAHEKPVEELYDTHADPFEIHNLADDPAFSQRLSEMRHALSKWQNEIGDVGLIPEAEIEILEQDAGSRFAILQSTTKNSSTEKRLALLVDIATSASEGPAGIPKLLDALQNEDASIRYWAATGIGNIGPAAMSTLKRVAESLNDPSPSVRIAAARAVAKLGSPEKALPVLEAELQSDHQWGRLAAAIVLDEMDEEARPALPSLQQALLNQPNKYIVRVANRAINELENTDHQVP
ncbi:MAG: sulfatase-like hydrolase/transferase [Pirellulales bacterium]|nr:sulfatase-like hydrolase/transferase [Pirellulales bacterium]